MDTSSAKNVRITAMTAMWTMNCVITLRIKRAISASTKVTRGYSSKAREKFKTCASFIAISPYIKNGSMAHA